ncbi:MAG: MBL fold metallo-hydrolase [Candidatus Aenigmarchaeota archaeon]|nr:MBL fold metallo-hydrolase [Candidatus Aenigmarchaeota archaeon]
MNSITYNNIKIIHLGHASFRIETNNYTIYIDPYAGDDYSKKADLILITHNHFDHLDLNKIKLISTNNTKIVLSKSCEEESTKTINNKTYLDSKETTNIDNIKITTTLAYNINKSYHPKDTKNVGYILDINGTRIYYAGDTDLIPELSEIKNIDVLLIPIGGTFTMDEIEAAKATNIINPKIVIPMHYNYIKGTEKNPEIFAQKVYKTIDVKLI